MSSPSEHPETTEDRAENSRFVRDLASAICASYRKRMNNGIDPNTWEELSKLPDGVRAARAAQQRKG